MKTRTLIAAALLLFTGCVSSARPTALNTGQMPEQQAADTKACEVQGEAAKSPGDFIVGGIFMGSALREAAYQGAYKECMTAKGYTVKD